MASKAKGPKPVDPPKNCDLCPRLVDFRLTNKATHPEWFNAPVPAFGPLDCKLLVVGLAPGLQGANRTGRPFTGDYAGDLLYPTLIKFGWAKGTYGQSADDDLKMTGARITNAVRCVPPQNKPVGAEQKACRDFLVTELKALKNLEIILALGGIAHAAVLTTLGLKKSEYPFKHAAQHDLGDDRILADSYHCSRYNLNTRRLTTEMFEAVFRALA